MAEEETAGLEALCDHLAPYLTDKEGCKRVIKRYDALTSGIGEGDEKDMKKITSSAPVTGLIFTQTECPYCERTLSASMRSMAKDKELQFFEVNTDFHGKLADEYSVKKLPTIVYFKGGSPAGVTIEGSCTEEHLLVGAEKAKQGLKDHMDIEEGCPFWETTKESDIVDCMAKAKQKKATLQ